MLRIEQGKCNAERRCEIYGYSRREAEMEEMLCTVGENYLAEMKSIHRGM